MRRPVALLLVVAAFAAAQTVQEVEPPDEGTGLEASNCFQCHEVGGGRLGPSLASMYTMEVTGPDDVAINEPLTFQVTVRNDWNAELRDLQASLDLRASPALSLDARPEPLLGRVNATTLPAPEATQLDQDRTALLPFFLPAGATEARILVEPETTEGPEAPRPLLRLIDPRGDAQDLPRPDAGAPTAVAWSGDHVPGTWNVELTLPSFAGQLPDVDRSALVEQTFRVTADAWFNVTSEERVRFASTAAPLDGQQPDTPQEWTTTFTVFLVEPTRAELTLRTELEAYYEHPNNAATYDDWPFAKQQTLVLDGTPPVVPNATAPEPEPERIDLAGWGEAVGYWAAFSTVLSIATGGMLGKRSRRLLNRAFRSARHRIVFHNVVSYSVLLAAAAHTILFLVEAVYHWSIGLLLGGVATLALASLGVTGALQVPIIRRTNFTTWQLLHWSAAWGTLVFTALHMLLDGAHYQHVAEAVGWDDPLADALGAP